MSPGNRKQHTKTDAVALRCVSVHVIERSDRARLIAQKSWSGKLRQRIDERIEVALGRLFTATDPQRPIDR